MSLSSRDCLKTLQEVDEGQWRGLCVLCSQGWRGVGESWGGKKKPSLRNQLTLMKMVKKDTLCRETWINTFKWVSHYLHYSSHGHKHRDQIRLSREQLSPLLTGHRPDCRRGRGPPWQITVCSASHQTRVGWGWWWQQGFCLISQGY